MQQTEKAQTMKQTEREKHILTVWEDDIPSLECLRRANLLVRKEHKLFRFNRAFARFNRKPGYGVIISTQLALTT